MNNLSNKIGYASVRQWLPLLALSCVWMGLGGMDWLMRFHLYQWHRSFLVSTFKPRYVGDWPPMDTIKFKATRGGDLSHLLGVPEAIEQYGVNRSDEGEVLSDEFGFPNIPPTTNRYYPVVLVGDSFLLQGRSSSNLLGARLERELGTSVYTIAHAGRGSAFAMSGFFDHPHFKQDAPKTVLWFVSERDASGFFFDSVAAQAIRRVVYTNYVAYAESVAPSEIDWTQLMPSRLRLSLPNTSALAQAARRASTWLRFRVFKLMNDSIVLSRETFSGHTLLFYGENLKALAWPPDVRDVPKIRRAAFYTNRDYFAARGIRWVIVLIPEKEQVYRELVPPSIWTQNQPLPPSSFGDIEDALNAEGIGVVNLLTSFRAAALAGDLLYWPDDTHWNNRGMAIAADVISQELESEPGLH